MGCKIAILVVLYNKMICESKTLRSLKDELNSCESNVELFIWNNGPVDLVLDYDVNCEVNLINDLNNKALSKVYNSFIEMSSSEKYIILDDDSELSFNFLSRANKVRADHLGLPIVKTTKGVVYPIVNNKINHNIESGTLIDLSECDFVKSIGSGLVISVEIINRMKKTYGFVFDERFFLYGVDTTFFINLNKMNFRSFYIYGKICHSLSKEEELSDFRIKEFTYSYALINRYYTSFPLSIVKLLSVPIIKFLSRSKYKSISIKYMFIGFFSGKHYRSLK